MGKQTFEEESLLFDNFDFSGFEEDTELTPVHSETENTEKKETNNQTENTDEIDDISFFEETEDEEETPQSNKKVETTKQEKIEEEEEETEDTEQDKKETPSDNNSSSSYLQVLAQALYEEGVLSSLDENLQINKASDFIELINKEIVTNVEAYKEDLPEEIKTLINHYEEGVSLEALLKLRVEADNYKRIDPETLGDQPDLMKQLIRADLKNRGYEEEEINDEIKDIFALDRQEPRAKKALSTLIKKQAENEIKLVEDQKKKDQELSKQREESIKAVKKLVDETKEFAGIELSKKVKEDAFSSLMKPIATVNGRPVSEITKAQMENPVDFQGKLALAWTLTKGFTDWGVFGKATKSKTMVELEEKARLAAEKIKPGVIVRESSTKKEEPGSFLKGIRL